MKRFCLLTCRELGRCTQLETLHIQAQASMAEVVSQLPRLQHLILDEPPRAESFVLPEGALPASLQSVTIRLPGKSEHRSGPQHFILAYLSWLLFHLGAHKGRLGPLTRR